MMELDMDSFLHRYGGRSIDPRDLEIMFFGEWDRQFRQAIESGSAAAFSSLEGDLKKVIAAAEQA